MSVIECDVEDTTYGFYSSASELGWKIREAGDWGVICSPGTSGNAGNQAASEFEITWRYEGGKTRLSVYGPLHVVSPSFEADIKQVVELEQAILESIHAQVHAG